MAFQGDETKLKSQAIILWFRRAATRASACCTAPRSVSSDTSGISSLLHAVAISWLERLPAGAHVGVHDSGIVESDGPSTLDAHFRIARTRVVLRSPVLPRSNSR
jgi:hypothetical protein